MSESKSKRAARQDANSIKSLVFKIITGSATGTIIMFFMLVAEALIILKAGLPYTVSLIAALIAAGIGAIVSGYIAVLPIKKRGIFFGSLSACPMAVFATAIMLILMRSGIGTNIMLMLGVMIAGGAIGGIMAANKKAKNKMKR